jgi:hypothetical protein
MVFTSSWCEYFFAYSARYARVKKAAQLLCAANDPQPRAFLRCLSSATAPAGAAAGGSSDLTLTATPSLALAIDPFLHQGASESVHVQEDWPWH